MSKKEQFKDKEGLDLLYFNPDVLVMPGLFNVNGIDCEWFIRLIDNLVGERYNTDGLQIT